MALKIKICGSAFNFLPVGVGRWQNGLGAKIIILRTFFLPGSFGQKENGAYY
jgi:hypothetical protein